MLHTAQYLQAIDTRIMSKGYLPISGQHYLPVYAFWLCTWLLRWLALACSHLIHNMIIELSNAKQVFFLRVLLCRVFNSFFFCVVGGGGWLKVSVPLLYEYRMQNTRLDKITKEDFWDPFPSVSRLQILLSFLHNPPTSKNTFNKNYNLSKSCTGSRWH